MSDDEPPPPPPDDDDPTVASDAERYIAYLDTLGHPADDLHEDRSQRVGDWRFYYRGDAMPRTDAAGLDSQGHAVSGFAPSDWYPFLTTPELDADAALRRIAWLLGRPGPVDATYHLDDPDIAARVGDPTIGRRGDTVTFEGWVIYPPEMQSPHRLRIAAPPETAVSIEAGLWSEEAAR